MNLKNIRKDFPIFRHHNALVYLDSTATSLKPQSVIEKEVEYYEQYSANVFRGIYKISERATSEYKKTREIVAQFINANKPEEIVFTRSTTESLNLLAYSLGRKIVNEGDEIVSTIMEHHSNFVPWQQLAIENGSTFKVINVNNDGYLDLDNLKSQMPASPAGRSNIKSAAKNSNLEKLKQVITRKTKILALTYVSNVLGTINPMKEIAAAAKKINPNIMVIVDAAQALPHMKVDVRDLGVDFVAFSSHKMLGPTGVGVLWGKYNLLQEMFPFNYGGEMIQEVYVDRTVFKEPPLKFEAGTPHIAGVIALKEAIHYLRSIGLDVVRRHEMEITQYAINLLLSEFKGQLRILGPRDVDHRGGIVTFTFANYHPHDVAQILDEDNICIRVGHHCAMPLHESLRINATARASFYIYNTKDDVEKLVEGLKKVQKILR